jgi:hypothetical protein
MISEKKGILTLFFCLLSGWFEQIPWATCIEGESKKIRPGYFDNKV